MKLQSESQIATGHGAKSRGPVAQDRNCASLLNFKRRAAFARCLTLPGEDETQLLAMLDGYREDFQPVGLLEERAIETLVAAEWRRRRMLAIQNSVVDMDELLKNIPALERFSRYDAMLTRIWHDALTEIENLQRERHNREAQNGKPTSARHKKTNPATGKHF